MKSCWQVFLVPFLVCGSEPTLRAAFPGTESLAKLIVAEFDTNSDEAVDAGEWQGGIEGSFAKLDGNSDGSLQADEADGLSKDIAEKTGDLAAGFLVTLIKQLLLSLDTDGDKLVSQKEYNTLSTDVFTKLDTDKNNRLSLAELCELPVKMLVK
jgi:hypothetical protein